MSAGPAAAAGPVPATPPTRPVNPRAVFVVVIAAIFVSNLDLFVVNVALPSIGRDFRGASLGSLSWILNAYAIVFAALLVVAGRLADRSGHRRGFLAGLVIFTVGSTLCALAPDVATLVVARVVQATGAAVLIPTSLALLLAVTAPARRSAAVRAWSAVGGVAAALGPVLGGLLVQASWRWVFLINVPIGIAAIVLGIRALPETAGDRDGPLPDLAGAGLLVIAVGALSLGLVEGGDWGWSSGRIVTAFAAALVLSVVFLARSARHLAPVIELPILRIRTFRTSTVAVLLFNLAFAAMLLSVVLWCQQVWGYSALRTGLAVAPGPLMVPPLAVGAGPLARRIGSGPVAAAGTLLLGGGVLWWLTHIGIQPHYATELLPGMMLTGVGVGLGLPTLIAAMATSLPPHRFATGSGINTMARQMGSVLGVAILVSMLGTPATPDQALTAFQHIWIVIVVVSAAAALTSITLRRSPAPTPSPILVTEAVPDVVLDAVPVPASAAPEFGKARP
jgi:EmrB/QacA subfamily drug resistance transporter